MTHGAADRSTLGPSKAAPRSPAHPPLPFALVNPVAPLAAVALLLALASCAATEVEVPDPRLIEQHDQVPLAADVSDLGWLAGRWQGQGLGGTIDEVWLPPAGGAMTGTFRLTKDGTPAFYELGTLARYGSGLVMSVKHFDPDLTAWEERDHATRFALLRLDDQTAWFDGLTIRRQGDRILEILSMHDRDGTVHEEQIRLELVE